MKKAIKLTILTILLVCVFALAGCTSFDVWLEQQRCVHTWNDGEITVTATCTRFGETLFTCTKCSKTKTTQNQKLPHTEHTVAQQDATCTETGLTEYVVCSVCQSKITQPSTLPALGHDVEIHEHVDATCLKTGKTEGKYCKRCDEWIIEQTTIPATGHDLGALEIPATCTTDGATGGVICKNCDTIYTPATAIPALGHNVVDGRCTRCGLVTDVEAFFAQLDTLTATEIDENHVTTSGYYRIYIDATYDGTIAVEFDVSEVYGVNYISAYGQYIFRHIEGVGVVDTSLSFDCAVNTAGGSVYLSMLNDPALSFKAGDGWLDLYFHANSYTATDDSGKIDVLLLPNMAKLLQNSAVLRVVRFA